MSDIEITQEDRNAAASVTVLSSMRSLIRLGKSDDHPLVQAFAAHRRSSAQRTIVGVAAWLDQSAQLLREIGSELDDEDHLATRIANDRAECAQTIAQLDVGVVDKLARQHELMA
ncbi:hypothetical protein [Novosphingobium cyanobacteriorum]|uniref:Uncharacterized protein n=1 Tax=Novosphingobium cyanobacteriorum TaxID=3024215 RepID=A0ABT6CPY7_9SPHN|nr:hypothetical protein [Novosphingobium cyanobacteriorum]MDF8335160.1 hypothetical protein [Novosphingobium cyanobacteriorum]